MVNMTALHLETGSSDLRSSSPLVRGRVRGRRTFPWPPPVVRDPFCIWGHGRHSPFRVAGAHGLVPGKAGGGTGSSANGLFLTLFWGTASASLSSVESEVELCRQVGQMSLESDADLRQTCGGRVPGAKRGCLVTWPGWTEMSAGQKVGC